MNEPQDCLVIYMTNTPPIRIKKSDWPVIATIQSAEHQLTVREGRHVFIGQILTMWNKPHALLIYGRHAAAFGGCIIIGTPCTNPKELVIAIRAIADALKLLPADAAALVNKLPPSDF